MKSIQLIVLPLLLLIVTACGYHFGQGELSNRYGTISVPYVVGDRDGDLTAEIIKQISASGSFEYRQSGGNIILHVEIMDIHDENIGYRYDRKKNGELKHSVIPTETRVTLIAEVSLIDAATCRMIQDPARISASLDFDHDYYSSRNSINIFSLGQLTDIEAAREAVQHPLNIALAQKIVEYINNVW